MVTVDYDIFDAPKIGEELTKTIEGLKNQHDYVLALQLNYRENTTIFNLNELDKIIFKEDLVEIVYKNNTHVFFSYINILEYCIINKEDVIELEGVKIEC